MQFIQKLISFPLEGMRTLMQILHTELDKLQVVAASIKQQDFEMTKFAHQLLQMDQHKLELMRKIETLERLVAMERRRGTSRR